MERNKKKRLTTVLLAASLLLVTIPAKNFISASLTQTGGYAWLMALALLTGITTIFILFARKDSHLNDRDGAGQYQSVIHQLSDGILLADTRDGKILESNESFWKAHGYSGTELVSLSIFDLFTESRITINNMICQCLQGKHAPREDLSCQNKDGSQTIVEVSVSLINHGSQEVLCLVTRDSSERKKAEDALRESESLYRQVVENIDLGIMLIDNQSRVVISNSAAGRIAGKSFSDFIQKECYSKFTDKESQCLDCPGKVALETGKPAILVRETTNSHGNRLVIRIQAFPLFDQDGTASKFIEVFEDITEQTVAEEENRHLELLLRHSQKMEAMGTLAGGVAHDFNNILTAIIGYCAIMQMKTPETDPMREYITKVFESAERAAALTKSLLASSRRQPLDMCSVDLNQITRSIEHILSRLIDGDIELTTRITDKELPIIADSLQLEQVLMNLATNAKDAMPGGGRLEITTERIELDQAFVTTHGFGTLGKYALLTVTDTGSGIDEKFRERIFEPFFTTKEVGKGTGLGLSIAFGIIKQHHGYIHVSSEPGKGTTFSLYFPLSDLAPKCVPAPLALPQKSGSETILLIEDNPGVRGTLKELLENNGYDVIDAVDGEDGIEKFRESTVVIDLLIIDMIMPKMNGVLVYEKIQEIHPETATLFMSGYTTEILDAKGVSLNETSFLFKPIESNQLLAKIREVLDSR